ncbi:MDR family MFS transporter [Zavarzinia sp. CC-PAN008]|uniref:MDR family MFS transporter n=1 Tax=Zavarzinia sp. CC-PAN008 TaxID=3243332 RepID=UPI003F749207
MSATTAPPTAAGQLTHADIRTIVVGIMLAMFLSALDGTIVAAALPTIGAELGNVTQLPWVVTAYLLSATAVTPLMGKFSDIHGRRITLMIGISVFVVGSVACALAPDMLSLILARGLQGLGGGGLIALAQTILADMIAPRERAKYQVYFASVFILASLLGPVLGGLFAEHLHWSLIFWINLPLGIGAFLMSQSALRRLPRHDRPHRLDWLGVALMAGGTVALLLALSWGGVHYPWGSPPVLGMFAAALGLSLAFALRMLKAEEPLIPLTVLGNQVVRMGTLAACFGMGTFVGLSIFVPVYFQAVQGLSPGESGLAVIPLMVGTVVGATASGRALALFDHYKRLPTAGLACSALCMLALALGAEAMPFWVLVVVLALSSLGFGMLLPVATVSVQNAVAPHEMGIATGTINFFRQLGGAVLVAVFGAIVLGMAGAAGISAHGEGDLVALLARQPDPAGIFAWVYGAAALGFALSLAFFAGMEERPLRAAPRPDADPA